MNFRSLTIDDKETYASYMNNPFYMDYHASELNFANLIIWGRDQARISIDENYLIIQTVINKETVYLPPVVKDIKYINEAIEKIIADNPKATIFGIDEIYLPYIYNQELKPISNYDEYLYSTKDLIDLAGLKYKKKRNNVHQFKRLYNTQVSHYTPSDFDACVQLYNEWNVDNEIMEEFDALKFALQNYEVLKLDSLLLRVENKLIAFSFGIKMNNVAIILFEKGNTKYKGVFQAINQMMVEINYSSLPFINRQEDLGIDALRISKKSYSPIQMIKKYAIIYDRSHYSKS